MSGGPMATYLRRVGMAAITDEDVRRDPAASFEIALATMRAAYRARLASAAGAREGHDPSSGHGAQPARAAAESRDAQPQSTTR
jgi:hypothetical protein